MDSRGLHAKARAARTAMMFVPLALPTRVPPTQLPDPGASRFDQLRQCLLNAYQPLPGGPSQYSTVMP
jgi:hypothetical protein